MSEQLSQDLVTKIATTEVKVDALKESITEVKELLKDITKRQTLAEEANRNAIEKARDDYRKDRADDILSLKSMIDQVTNQVNASIEKVSDKYAWTLTWKHYAAAGVFIAVFLYYFIKPWYEGYVKALMQP